MNVCENIVVGAKLFSDRDAIVFEQQRLTYAELDSLSAQAASILQDRGLSRGDRVGLVVGNVPAFVVWYYAVLRLGAVAVSVSTRLAPSEVAFVLSDCGARALVVTEDDVEHACAELPECVAHVIPVSEDAEQCQGQRLTRGTTADGPVWVDTEPHDPATILYTSGTTGFPKGATLSHQNVRATVHAFNHLCQMREDDRMLLAVPLFHCYGQNALLNSALNVGATLVIQRRFDLNESKHLITHEQVTKLFGVPTTFQLLLDCCEPSDLDSVTYCFSAAATLPIQISDRWRAKFGMPIYEGYGLTETAPFASYNHRARYVPGSIGTPVDLVEMKIVDPETRETLAPGTLGEIAIRGPNVMLGYWNRPEETAEAIRDGWFFSGDIGRMDESGYFYIVDRLKDMISIAGMKVFPAEVERVLLDHPVVSETAVVGFADPVFGEQVVAFVVCDEPKPDLRQVLEYCRANLATFKVPRHLVVIDELPRNPAGKVLKNKLRERNLVELLAMQTSPQETVDQPAFDSESGPLKLPSDVRATTVAAPMTASVERMQSSSRLRKLLSSVHATSRQREIATFLQDEVLDLADLKERPDADSKLIEIGLDSLMIVELRDRLQMLVGSQIELPATLVFDHPRICDLAMFLSDVIEAESGSVQEHATANVDANHSAASVADAGSTSQQPDIGAMSEQQALLELLREIDE